MNYRKFDKAMQKADIQYDIEEMNTAVQIKTAPDENETALINIEPALGKDETCINSSPGNFNVIETDIKVYKTRVKPRNDLES